VATHVEVQLLALDHLRHIFESQYLDLAGDAELRRGERDARQFVREFRRLKAGD